MEVFVKIEDGTAMEKITEEICSRYKIQFQNNGLISLKLGY